MNKPIETPVVVAATTTLAAVLIAGILYWKQKKCQMSQQPLSKIAIPKKWTKVGEVKALIMYPLKGGKRKCVSEAQCTERGLREIESANITLQDRVFIVYNHQHEFLNAKKYSKMLLIETTAVDESRVKFSFPEAEDLFIQIPDGNSPLSHIDLHNKEKIGTVDCGGDAAAWFSQRLLGQPDGLRLGCFLASVVPPRTVEGTFEDKAKVYKKLHSDYLGAYSDIASYMLISEESVNDLNKRLVKPVTEHNFRPNIVVKNSAAYSEDGWDWVKVGEHVVLRSFKYCTRCVVTVINPDTAERDPSYEPFRTLKTYRQVKEPHLKELEGDLPVMGQYLGCHCSGYLKVGDPVYVGTK